VPKWVMGSGKTAIKCTIESSLPRKGSKHSILHGGSSTGRRRPTGAPEWVPQRSSRKLPERSGFGLGFITAMTVIRKTRQFLCYSCNNAIVFGYFLFSHQLIDKAALPHYSGSVVVIVISVNVSQVRDAPDASQFRSRAQGVALLQALEIATQTV